MSNGRDLSREPPFAKLRFRSYNRAREGSRFSKDRNAMKTYLATAGLALALAAGQAHAAGACLRQANIYSWSALNDKTVIVEDDFHNKYKLSLMSPCLNLQYKLALGFRTFGGTALSCVTRGDEVIASSPIGPQHCPISNIAPYTPDMEKADKAAAAAAKAQH